MHKIYIFLLGCFFSYLFASSGIYLETNTLIYALLVVYVGVMLLYLIYKSNDIFLAIFYWSIFFFLIIPFSFQLHEKTNPWRIKISDNDLNQLVFLITLSLFVFHIGYNILSRKKTRHGIKKNKKVIKHPCRSILILTFLLMLFNLFIVISVGPSYFFSSRTIFFGQLISSGLDQGYNLWIYAYAPKIFSLLGVASLLFIKKLGCKNRYIYYSLLFANIILFIIINSPTSTPRFIMFFSIIVLYYVLQGFHSKRKVSLFFVILTFVMTVLSNALSTLRVGKFGEIIEMKHYFLSGDFDASINIILTMRYIYETGFKYGESIVSILFSFVPRSIWEGKYMGAASSIAEYHSLPNANISMPIFAELWIDFGYLGTIALFTLFGFYSKKISILASYNKGSLYNPSSLFAISFAAMTPWFVRGSLLVAFSLFLAFITWFLLLIFIDKLFRVNAVAKQ